LEWQHGIVQTIIVSSDLLIQLRKVLELDVRCIVID
jgi:hypothetical protein